MAYYNEYENPSDDMYEQVSSDDPYDRMRKMYYDDYNSDNGYNDGYNDGYNGGNYYDDGYNDNNERGYDSEEYESSDREDPPRSYRCRVSQDQFVEDVENYIKQIREDKSCRLGNSLRERSLAKQMYRVYSRSQILFCVDVEAWEQDHNKITEIGIAIYDPRDQELSFAPHIKNFHMIISEHNHLKNGKYVPDNKAEFMGGPSWHFSLDDARRFLQNLIDLYFHPNHPMHCALTGHDLKGDLDWLHQLGVEIPNHIRKLDTKVLYAYTHGHDGASLKNALRAVKQPHAFLHNAGNDAYFTIMLALKLCDPGSRQFSRLDYLSGGDGNEASEETLLRSMVFLL